MEHKTLPIDRVAAKFDAAKVGIFSGYASTFGGVDAYGDTVMPGAFAKTLAGRNRPVALRWNHFGPVIGKWTQMEEDDVGLFVAGELTPGHSVASDAYALLKHGAVSGLSIGYRPTKAVPNKTEGFDLHEIELVEISVVESPADLGAQVDSVKAAISAASTVREIEAALRDAAQFSRADACALVSRIKSLVRGELAAEEQARRELAAIFQSFQLSKE